MHDVNYLAVLVAGFLPMVVGMVWYGPLFGKRWLELMETTEEAIRKDFNPLKAYGPSIVLSLITAWVLAQLLSMAGDGGGGGASVISGVHIALLVLVGFNLPLQQQGVTFEKRKPGLARLSFGYNFVSILLQAILLATWT